MAGDNDCDISCGVLIKLNFLYPLFLFLGQLSVILSITTCWWQKEDCNISLLSESSCNQQWSGPLTVCPQHSSFSMREDSESRDYVLLVVVYIVVTALMQIMAFWTLITKRNPIGYLMVMCVLILGITNAIIFAKCYINFTRHSSVMVWHVEDQLDPKNPANKIVNVQMLRGASIFPYSALFSISAMSMPAIGMIQCIFTPKRSERIHEESIRDGSTV